MTAEDTDVVRMVRRLDGDFMQAASAKDADGLANRFYAADAVLILPGSQVEGRENIATFFRQLIDRGASNLTLETTTIESGGDVAYGRGTYAYEVSPRDGSPAKELGVYSIVYRRQLDGAWRAVSHKIGGAETPSGSGAAIQSCWSIPADVLDYEFERRGPWVTKFRIGGRDYGGAFDAMGDVRLEQFFASFPDATTILELGSLEGGHTFGLARRHGVERVVAIEGRQANVSRAQFVQRVLGVTNVLFITANLETTPLEDFGRFDAVFCSGLLYHLPDPWRLTDQLHRVTENLFIWTHYAEDAKAIEQRHGLRGMPYQEFGLEDPLSGFSATSFWPTYDSLMQMLVGSGFKTIRVLENSPTHPHGPSITLTAGVS